MRGRVLRMIVLLWLGWYLSGPLAATVDSWDGPRQEFRDIQFNAGGGVVLVACVFCFSILLAEKFRERLLSPFRNIRQGITSVEPGSRPQELMRAVFGSNHSPPFSLRI
jgi:hypothetical protein